MDVAFTGRVVEWRGPAPFYFVPLTEDAVAEVREVARMATYGWGVVPVEATVGGREFTTSLFPREGGYWLPLKDAVRRPAGLAPGDEVTVRMRVLIG